MFVFHRVSQNIFPNVVKINHKFNTITCISSRLLNYSSIPYDEKRDPTPLFFNKEVQHLLRTLTRVDLNKVYRKRKLGQKKLADPEYKFMTTEQLEEAVNEAKKKLDDHLQIPPVVPTRVPISKVFSKDPELQGLLTSKLIFTDITFGIKDADRLITMRTSDGVLKEADWETRRRINQIYFPKPGRSIKSPIMFEDNYLESLLKREEYIFILDRACVQYEPNDPEYQRITSVTYQHINDHGKFDILRSTRHFGALTFFLVWNDIIDNLLLDLLETTHVDEANVLLNLYSKAHNVQFESDGHLKAIEKYIEKHSKKKGILELALQAFKDLEMQKEKLEKLM